MTRSPDLRAINCTACGAGLDVLGGGRVATHICPYCGTALDAQADYKVIASYSGIVRPSSPLRPGMSGQIDGVTFTVIGTLGWEERYGGRTWTWVDHQVFSPTHGYAWLTVEDGHLIFSRRYRKPCLPDFITSATVERAETRPDITSEGETFRYYETSTAEITYAEGEFNWTPKVGDRATVVSCLGPDTMLSFEESATEREVEVSTWLPPAAYAAFGAEAPRHVSRNHPLMPYPQRHMPKFYMTVPLVLAVLSLFLGILFGAAKGTQVARVADLPVSGLPLELHFTITDTARLAEIEVWTDVTNAWAWFEVGLTDPDDTPVFEAGREVGFYSGRDNEGTWTEGTRRTRIRFHPETPGDHVLDLALAESERDTPGGALASRVTVTVTEGLSTGWWLFLLTAVFLAIPLLVFLRAGLANTRRWSGSDWTDEDEDD